MAIDLNTIVSVLATLSPIFLATIGGVGWLYKHEKERRESIERQVSEKKYETYIVLINLFFEIIKSGKNITSQKLVEIVDKLYDSNKNLILYGSDEVVKKFQKYILETRNQGRADLNLFGDIIIAIRKDMGNPKTEVTTEDFLRQILTDYDEAKKKGLI